MKETATTAQVTCSIPADNKSFQFRSPTSVRSPPNASIPPTDALGGCKKLLASPVASKKALSTISQPPLLYVGIIMQRPTNHDPSSPFSWGISMIKENAHVHVVGVNSRTPATVQFCRVSNQAPNPSIVYNMSQGMRLDNEDYESSFKRLFPPSWKLSSSNLSSILTPCLQMGDTIVSINGVSVSFFDSIASIATYIRQHCKDKLLLVALRHHVVWKSAWNEMNINMKIRPTILQAKSTEQQQRLQQKIKEYVVTEKKARVSRAIGEGWRRVQKTNYTKAVKRKADLNKPASHPLYIFSDTRQLANPKFCNNGGEPILYSDNDDVDPDDGRRFHLFSSKTVSLSFDDWLKARKVVWGGRRKNIYLPNAGQIDDEVTSVPHDFWLDSGFKSFDEWLSTSKATWRRTYSWHKDKKMKLQAEAEKEVHFPTAELITSHASSDVALGLFNDWLGVRKQQWRIIRRKRQLEYTTADTAQDASTHQSDDSVDPICISPVKSRRLLNRLSSSNDTMIIDEIIKDQQLQEQERTVEHAPLDISWIFDSEKGAPDDVIVLLMRFLNPSDHGNLLCLSWVSNFSFKKRDSVWQSLCPKRWILPRRPRKSWCDMYITKIRSEEEASRKQSDDLLMKADGIIDKGDILTQLQKIVNKAQKDFSYNINYTSGLVLERNSLLNMAVISKRKNIVKWLVEHKHSDIETSDRGNFTPLLNAAWNGDKYLVRYLLGKGADRKKVGTFHSSKGVASKEFEGMTAEGWARERGHFEVADLIQIGL